MDTLSAEALAATETLAASATPSSNISGNDGPFSVKSEHQSTSTSQHEYTSAEIGALAHLYRGEMYQSKIWRNRLDTTTNWAVVITGIALSVSFSNIESSPVPLLLVPWVVVVFLLFEARRYLYYDLFRVRVRVMEINFYGPMLLGKNIRTDNGWNRLLADDYLHLRFHITLLEAVGRRLRRTYGWILAILFACYFAKVVVHPTPLASFSELWVRMAIGPIPGQLVMAFGVLFHGTWMAIALFTLREQKAVGLPHRIKGPDSLLRVAGGARGTYLDEENDPLAPAGMI